MAITGREWRKPLPYPLVIDASNSRSLTIKAACSLKPVLALRYQPQRRSTMNVALFATRNIGL